MVRTRDTRVRMSCCRWCQSSPSRPERTCPAKVLSLPGPSPPQLRHPLRLDASTLPALVPVPAASVAPTPQTYRSSHSTRTPRTRHTGTPGCQGDAVEEKVAPSSQTAAKSKVPAKPKRPRLDSATLSNALSEPTFRRAGVAAGAGYWRW